MNVHEDVLKNGYYSYKLHMEGHLSFSVLLYLILDEIFSGFLELFVQVFGYTVDLGLFVLKVWHDVFDSLFCEDTANHLKALSVGINIFQSFYYCPVGGEK